MAAAPEFRHTTSLEAGTRGENKVSTVRMKSLVITGVLLALAVVAVAVLALATMLPGARERRQNIALGREWSRLLRESPTFSARRPDYPVDVSFQYAPPSDPDLTRLRHTYPLDSIAGRGSEIERIINLTRWTFRLTGHANEPEIPKELNAFNLIHLARDEHMQINCYMKTVILNEIFLAMGFPSRQTHLLPHSREEDASHFVTSVYSRTLGRWIFMDPDMGAYVTNEKGEILGVSEVRDRLVRGRALVVRGFDGGGLLGFEGVWGELMNFKRGVSYPWFLSDFVFKIECPQVSAFNQRSRPDRLYFELIPDGYRPELLRAPDTTKSGRRIVFINDEGLFWQKPAGPSR